MNFAWSVFWSFAVVGFFAYVSMRVEALVKKVLQSTYANQVYLLGEIDTRDNARYAQLLRMLTTLRRQNEVLMNWADKQHASYVHEEAGRPEEARQVRIGAPVSSQVEDWQDEEPPLDWEMLSIWDDRKPPNI